MSSLPDSEYSGRLSDIRRRIARHEARAYVSFDNYAIEYLVGFPHVQTERPVALVVTEEWSELLVPRLERRRAERFARVDGVTSYFDYPTTQPVVQLADSLRERDIRSVVADADGAPSVMGYDGPPLSKFLSVETQPWVREARRTKSSAERSLIRESAAFADRTHELLEARLCRGANPLLLSGRTTVDATEELLDTTDYEPRTRFRSPVLAGIVSGEQTALPHAYTAPDRLASGDVIISGIVVDIGGYLSELERTMIVGEPTDEQLTLLKLVEEAQSIAIDALEPGVPVSHVDEMAREYFREHGVLDLVTHHTGHALGKELHEPPYLDRGSDATARPGDVYAIEPALYTDDGGYRHSDTVLVTEDGCEVLTSTQTAVDEMILHDQ
jgi:Xaa-Pro aminopeptidase